jgi:Rrf2 family protein
MKISTRGRYALRVMIDLAQHNTGEFIPLTDIANRQEISEKYLESIISVLSKNGLLNALRGKGGGYKLAKAPQNYSVADILKLTEGSLAPVSCLETEENNCKRAPICKTLKMWTGLYELIENYFKNISIADLVTSESAGNDYII